MTRAPPLKKQETAMHGNGGSLLRAGINPPLNVSPPIDDRNAAPLAVSEKKDRRIRYEESFKLDAIRLWKTSRRSAQDIALELGISSASLYAWGRGSKSAAARYLRKIEEEIDRLREENAKLREQFASLEKTLGLLAGFSGVRGEKSPPEAAIRH